MSHAFLQNAWYILVGVLLLGYAILDGFDLGVGVLSPFVAKTDEQRRSLYNAIGPFWDGNEVWLLTGGGALFAAFPHVYATVFSGFYLALMLVLFALITRAVSLEFRSKVESPKWHRVWDWAFFVGSLLPALLTGVAAGNVIRGVPLDSQLEFTGNFFTLLNPYSLIVGLAGLAMFITQGAAYLMLKTEGPVAQRAKKIVSWSSVALLALFVVGGVVAWVDLPYRYENYLKNPIAWIVPLLAVIFMVATRLSLKKGPAARTFLLSSFSIAGLMGVWGIANYPYMLPARNAADLGLTIFNASASQTSLTTMFIIALIGMPIVIAYTLYIHWVFRGKVRAHDAHY